VQEVNELEKPSWTSGPLNKGHYVALEHQNPITRGTAAEASKLTLKDFSRVFSALVTDSNMNPVLTDKLANLSRQRLSHVIRVFRPP